MRNDNLKYLSELTSIAEFVRSYKSPTRHNFTGFMADEQVVAFVRAAVNQRFAEYEKINAAWTEWRSHVVPEPAQLTESD